MDGPQHNYKCLKCNTCHSLIHKKKLLVNGCRRLLCDKLTVNWQVFNFQVITVIQLLTGVHDADYFPITACRVVFFFPLHKQNCSLIKNCLHCHGCFLWHPGMWHARQLYVWASMCARFSEFQLNKNMTCNDIIRQHEHLQPRTDFCINIRREFKYANKHKSIWNWNWPTL